MRDGNEAVCCVEATVVGVRRYVEARHVRGHPGGQPRAGRRTTTSELWPGARSHSCASAHCCYASASALMETPFWLAAPRSSTPQAKQRSGGHSYGRICTCLRSGSNPFRGSVGRARAKTCIRRRGGTIPSRGGGIWWISAGANAPTFGGAYSPPRLVGGAYSPPRLVGGAYSPPRLRLPCFLGTTGRPSSVRASMAYRVEARLAALRLVRASRGQRLPRLARRVAAAAACAVRGRAVAAAACAARTSIQRPRPAPAVGAPEKVGCPGIGRYGLRGALPYRGV